jgi:hypothetical protein
MVTTDEIRAAIKYTPRMDTDADEDFAEMELSRDTLAAAYREVVDILHSLRLGVERLPPLTAIEGALDDECRAADAVLAKAVEVQK